MKKQNIIKNYTALGIVLFFTLINNALANPFTSVADSTKIVESGIFSIINNLVTAWFIVGVFWWLFTKRGFLMLVLLPLCGWAIINGRTMLFEFASTFVG